MVKVKIIGDWNPDVVERNVNTWLEAHRTSDIINIQYQVCPHVSKNYSVCITYSDGS
jgi:hypothetical protein